MMQGDDIRNQRQEAEKCALDADPQRIQILALWVIAEQLSELRAIAATFQEALQTGFGESNGYIRIQSEKGDRS